MKLRAVYSTLVVSLILGTTSVRADPNYVRRPHGWFVLMPPLTKPDPVTGLRYVDENAPEAKWTGMVIRGYDGHD